MRIPRREILKMGAAVAGYWLLSHTPAVFAQSSARVRIRPISGVNYSPSFLAFAKRARFKNPHDAIASVRDSKTPYELVWE